MYCRFFNKSFADLAQSFSDKDIVFIYAEMNAFKALGERENVTILPTLRLYKQTGKLPFIDYAGIISIEYHLCHVIEMYVFTRLKSVQGEFSSQTMILLAIKI